MRGAPLARACPETGVISGAVDTRGGRRGFGRQGAGRTQTVIEASPGAAVLNESLSLAHSSREGHLDLFGAS